MHMQPRAANSSQIKRLNIIRYNLYLGSTVQQSASGPTAARGSTTSVSSSIATITGSITTSYTYSDELNDPTSELFERYAASVESEMTSIMMQSASVDSISTRVTSFVEAENRRRRRQAKVKFCR